MLLFCIFPLNLHISNHQGDHPNQHGKNQKNEKGGVLLQDQKRNPHDFKYARRHHPQGRHRMIIALHISHCRRLRKSKKSHRLLCLAARDSDSKKNNGANAPYDKSNHPLPPQNAILSLYPIALHDVPILLHLVFQNSAIFSSTSRSNLIILPDIPAIQ